MTLEILPGRFGNLTDEQTQKLKDLWAHLLLITGILDITQFNEIKLLLKQNTLCCEKKHSFHWPFEHHNIENDASDHQILNEITSVISADEFRLAFWNMMRCDNPDNLLLRFLRARKWDLFKALTMMSTTFKWRLNNENIEEIDTKGEIGAIMENDEEFLHQLRSKKAFAHDRDLIGRPIVYIRPRFHNPKAQCEKSIEKFTLHIIESVRLMLEDPIDTATILFDLSGFTLSNMDFTAVKFMVKCFEAHYPECLGVLLIHKAPWIFSSIWSMIKNWLDPVVASKIQFTKDVNDLLKYIAKDVIPAELGGDYNGDYEYVEPKEEEALKVKDLITRELLLQERMKYCSLLEHNTINWIKAQGEEEELLIQERKEIVNNMRSQYWKLDAYSRVPSILDRLGKINHS